MKSAYGKPQRKGDAKTLRQMIVESYYDKLDEQQQKKQDEANSLERRVWTSVVSFFNLTDEAQKSRVELDELDGNLIAEYDGIAMMPVGGAYRLVYECECGKAAATRSFFTSFYTLGELLAKEEDEDATIIPYEDHWPHCPRDWAAEVATSEPKKVAEPTVEEILIDSLKRFFKEAV